MSNEIPAVTTEMLQAFADAWNRHDVDDLMSFMTEDCVFEASAGSDVSGTRYVGHEAVRAGFAEVQVDVQVKFLFQIKVRRRRKFNST